MKITKHPAKQPVEIIKYKGVNYRRYPLSTNRSISRYFYGKINKHNVALHRQVWIDHNGPIPEGYVVHHKDHDLDNNEIGNLECLSTKAHGKKHRIFKNDKRRKYKRDWARKNRSYQLKPKTEFECQQCGTKFKSHQVDRVKYCSDKCREQANRIKQGSQPLVEITCVLCNNSFMPKAANAKYCSDTCKTVARKQYERIRHLRRYKPHGHR